VPVGTTGESPTVDYEEHIRIIERSVKFARGKSRSSRHRRELDQRGDLPDATGRGCWRGRFAPGRAVLQQAVAGRVVPAFLRHRARDETAHRALQHPGPLRHRNRRRDVNRLARECKNIIGIKEAGGSCDRVSQLRAALGPKFEILSGDDSLTLPFMAVGAQGVISVASNVIPREVAQMVNAFTRGQIRKASQLHAKFYPLFKDLFIETNPVPVKATLAMMGQSRKNIACARADERD